MPFMVLVLLTLLTLPRQPEFNVMGALVISCVIALTLNFGWSVFWVTAIKDRKFFNLDSGIVRQTFDFNNPETVTKIDIRENPRNPTLRSADIQNAATQIWTQYHEPVTLVAPPLVLMTAYSEPWTAMHAPANLWFMPKDTRLVFLERTMRRMNRSGWILIQNDQNDPVAIGGRDLAKDLDEVYTKDITLTFGSYSAIRYLVRKESSAGSP
jgi:hypothetical protein